METRPQRRLPPGWAVMLTALAALVVLTAAPQVNRPRSTPELPRVEAQPSPTTSELRSTSSPASTTTAFPLPAGRSLPASASTPGPPTTTTAPARGLVLEVTPVSAVASQRWSTAGFLAAGTSSSASYLVPAGPAGRSLTLSTSGTGSVLVTGCGLEHQALDGATSIAAGGCSLELDLSGSGPLSFSLTTETG